MPYSKLSDLPPAVQKLPEHAQRIWMAAFNSAYSKYGEQKAFAIAWAAVNKWRGESLHPKFKRILELFMKQHGSEEGIAKFETFLVNNELDPTRDYTPTAQYRESYEWVTPLIKFYKQDSEAKYYLVTALTANISMNNNDYSDFAKMQKAAETMCWRPININHNHTQWLSFPQNRVDFSKANADEYAVECTIRIDNSEREIQQKLDNGEILHPSIEARGNLEGGYTFTGLALLEKGVELPGDPLTEIVPLFLNESVGKSICRLIDGKMVCDCEINEDANIESFGDASYPDSCFAYVPDSAKGENGNKSDRKFPYKNKDGSIDLPHVRNALARLDQADIPSAEKTRIRNLLQGILNRENPDYEPSESRKKEVSCEVTTNLSEKSELAKLKAEKSTLELENYNLKEKVEAEEAARKTAEANLTKQRLESTKLLEENNAKILTLTGQLEESHRAEANANKKIDALNKQISELIIEQNKHIGELQKQLTEALESRDQFKALSEKLAVEHENDVKKNQKFIEESVSNNNTITDLTEQLLTKNAEIKRLQEKIQKAQRFQTWAFKELKQAGVTCVEPQPQQ